MTLRATLKRAALVVAVATKMAGAANAVTWNSGNANWVLGSPGWSGITVPNAPGAVAEFTGITTASTATITAATTVGRVLYGDGTIDSEVTATIAASPAATILYLNNGGSGVLISNSNLAPSPGNLNRLVITAPLYFGNPLTPGAIDSVTISNTSGSTFASASGPVQINGAISGAVTKLTLESNSLSASTRFVGANTVTATNGILYRKGYIATTLSGTAFGGATSNGIMIGEADAGDVFLSSGNFGTIANSIVIAAAGTGSGFRGFSISNAGNSTFSGPVTLNGDFSVGSASNNNTTDTRSVNFNNAGGITGPGGLAINPARPGGSTANGVFHLSGIVKLSVANTYTGNTFVNRGTLNLSHQLAVQNSTVSVSSETIFSNTGPGVDEGLFVPANIVFSKTVAGNAFTFGGLAGSGNIALQNTDVVNTATTPTAPVPITLSIGNNDDDTTYSGVLGAGGSLIKIGEGETTLSSSNIYTGATSVNEGTLLINGSHVGGTAYTVGALGTLGGTGTISAAVGVNGTLSPGASIESLEMGTLSLNADSTYAYELDATSLVLADLTVVNGNLNLSLFDDVELSLVQTGTFDLGTKLALFNYSGEWNGGLFNGYTDGYEFDLGGNTWKINYADAFGGSNFTLDYFDLEDESSFVTITAVPEPSGMILTIFGLIGMAACKMHKRRYDRKCWRSIE